MKKIFVGGYAKSGSRVPMIILEKAGYYIGKNVNISYDFDHSRFPQVFKSWFSNKTEDNEKELKACLDEQVNGVNSWAIKHGYLMLIVPKLKKWYPESQFILNVRHPLDQMNRWRGFGFLRKAESTIDIDRYARLHNEALEHTDLLWRLEDICFDTVNAISKLFDFAEIEDDPVNYINLINISDTIGKYRNPIVEKLGYKF